MNMSIIFSLVFLAAVVGVLKPYIPNSKRWHFVIVTFAAFIMVGFTAPDVEMETTPKPEAASEAINLNETKLITTKGKWSYHIKEDKMRGVETRFALLKADNVITLDFPYGEQQGYIIVRKSSRSGFDLSVGVPSGQILCSSFEESFISAKFDDGGIERFRCTDSSDGTSDMVFLIDDKQFLQKLKKSKKLIVEAGFFQNGVQQMTFDTANLEWE
jgi:hypothetical protein